MKVKFAQSRPIQARTLEWVAFPFSRGSSQLRDQTQVSHICRGPAPVDPGNSKWGRRRRGSGNNCLIKTLIKDIKSGEIRVAQRRNSVKKRG